jgi:hypothetical protein
LNPRGWFGGPSVDVTTTTGIAAFQARLLSYADNAVIEMKRIGALGGILWDMEGQQFDQAYYGDPTQLETIAPELVGVLDAFMAKFTSAGLRIGFLLRPQVFNEQTGFISVSGNQVTWVSGTQFSPSWTLGTVDAGTITFGGQNHQIKSVQSPTLLTLTASAPSGAAIPFVYSNETNTADPGAVLKSKIQYAYNRWGASLFYIDVDLDWFHTITAAHYFQDIEKTFPGVLVFPEAKNTRHYAYTIPYNDAKNQQFGPDPVTQAVYPNSTTIIAVSDASAVLYPQQLSDALNQGNMLLVDGWYRHAANDFVLQLYSQLP